MVKAILQCCWKMNPFKQLSDLELGDEKVTLNHRLVNDVLHISLKCELTPRLGCPKAPNKMTMLLLTMGCPFLVKEPGRG